ncbi:MAG: sigma-70 family RNA polymerase sigma factor [Phycisphaerales bacterium]|nr:sigma-70 family RNA polymerase sigma factor [Phycisphaerales bacterium]
MQESNHPSSGGSHADPSTSFLLRDGRVSEELLSRVYEELRAQARAFLDGRCPGNTLQPTALVHEAYLRLVGNQDIKWEGRSHFVAVAAKAMRHVLADHARARRATKRGGEWGRVSLSGIGTDGREVTFDALDIHEALEKLAALNERHARIVELRFFGGLTEEEAAQVLGVSERTVRGDWRLCRAWLRQQLGDGQAP